MTAANAERSAGRALTAACLLSASGGAMDAWVYIGHGHVFANAQTGNIVLGAIALAAGQGAAALRHVPSLLAFCLGIILSRLVGAELKRHGSNSRPIRFAGELVGLIVLAFYAGSLHDGVVTAVVGFLAAVQISALSHIEGWSFNTGMTTGNLNSALSAASAAWLDPGDARKRRQAGALGAMCASFVIGATAGAAATLHYGDIALLGSAGVVIMAMLLVAHVPDD